MDELCDIKKVAQILQTSKTSIYRRMEAGAFPPPAIKDGRFVRWTRAQVQDWIDTMRGATGA